MKTTLLATALFYWGLVSATDSILTLPISFCSESNSTEAFNNISLSDFGRHGYLVSHRGYDFNLVSVLGNEAPLLDQVPLACKWRFVVETSDVDDDLQLVIRFTGVQKKRSKYCSKRKGGYLRFIFANHQANQSFVTEFCGSPKFSGETGYRLQQGASLVLDVRMVEAFRGFSFFYYAKKFQQPPTNDEASDKEPAPAFVSDHTGPLASVLSKAGNIPTDPETACRSSNGKRLTELSGKLRVRESFNFSESFQCKWQLRPALEENRQVKFIKLRISTVKQNATFPSCSDFVFEINLNDTSNVAQSRDLCRNGNTWQTVETSNGGIDFVFKSLKDGRLDNSTADFDFDFYAITTALLPEKQPTVVECGRSALQPPSTRVKRVVGGQLARTENWPWLAFLDINESVVCTANIINERWLLSVAKCFESSYAMNLSNNLEIENIFPHSLFHLRPPGFHGYDIALIKLKNAIDFESLGLSPICLPSAALNDSQLCYVAGRGSTKGTGEPGRLHEARIPVMTNEECRLMNPIYKLVTDEMICAGYKVGGIDACYGDIGGPLACHVGGRWELNGLVSWGKGCADRNAPGVYTKVSSYLDWIRQVIESFS